MSVDGREIGRGKDSGLVLLVDTPDFCCVSGVISLTGHEEMTEIVLINPGRVHADADCSDLFERIGVKFHHFETLLIPLLVIIAVADRYIYIIVLCRYANGVRADGNGPVDGERKGIDTRDIPVIVRYENVFSPCRHPFRRRRGNRLEQAVSGGIDDLH